MQNIIIGTHTFSFSEVKEKGVELLKLFSVVSNEYIDIDSLGTSPVVPFKGDNLQNKISVGHQFLSNDDSLWTSPVVPFKGDRKVGDFKNAFLLAQQWLNGATTFAFHTSGSTGVPKQIILTREQLAASAQATIEALGITSDDHIFHCLPTEFIGGAMLLIRGLIAQCDITFVAPSTMPIEALPEKHSYSIASFTPMQLYPILNSTERYENTLSQFKSVLIGGASIDSNLESKLASLKLVSIYHTYGMTETVSHIALRKIGKNKLFHTLPGIEIRMNEHDCLCIKGNITEQKWIETNDMVRMVNEKSFEILGRVDDVINSGGAKIFPALIEKILGDYLQLVPSNICAVGLPDKQFGQKLIVVIQSSNPIVVHKRELEKTLAGYQIPKAIYQLQAFPLTATGKLNKPELLKMLHLAVEIPLR